MVIVIAIALLAARALDFDVLGWLRRVVDDVRSVPLRYVIAVFVLKAVESLLAASAWRAILQATYPEQPITFRFVLGAFAGGLSINVVTPGMAGTAVMLGLYRLYIRGATMPTILATAVVENITFGLLAALTWIILIASTPSAADTISGAWDDVAAFFSDHPRVLLVTVVAIVVLLLVALYKSRRRLAEFWQQIVRGGAILRTPSRYLTHVVLPQVLSYVCRLGQTMVLMAAFGIPVTVHTV
ncbi:MAG TPA: lysylphosphatidylglycerol synthase domain-containing protein, partial [Thermomicrobiales bacterium]|nr:lysylphosphatidylglycerol synthase domain-containing protein [Thermomicrobiales bacterium]